MANGGREQLFHLREDPHELRNRVADRPDAVAEMRAHAVAACNVPNADRALEGDALKAFVFQERPRKRIVQMEASRGARGFPERPEDVLQP
jgi:choline-sulfatase